MAEQHTLDSALAANVGRFSGFAREYDHWRPGPPERLAELLMTFGGLAQLSLVVDLGSGTGLSTRYWADEAERVVGIEPSADMREQASAAGPTKITYRAGFSHATGLAAQCASVVSCSQSLHWMVPQPTFEEAARILVPGGVFAACDFDWPPLTGRWEADAAFDDCVTQARALEGKLNLSERLLQWDKGGHLERMRASGCFRAVREGLLHHVDTGNAERLVGLLLSQGSVMDLLKAGVSEAEMGIPNLRAVAARTLGTEPRRWHWNARVRMGVV